MQCYCEVAFYHTQRKRLGALSASLLRIPNGEEGLTHQKAALPFSETLMGWRTEQRRT